MSDFELDFYIFEEWYEYVESDICHLFDNLTGYLFWEKLMINTEIRIIILI